MDLNNIFIKNILIINIFILLTINCIAQKKANTDTLVYNCMCIDNLPSKPENFNIELITHKDVINFQRKKYSLIEFVLETGVIIFKKHISLTNDTLFSLNYNNDSTIFENHSLDLDNKNDYGRIIEGGLWFGNYIKSKETYEVNTEIIYFYKFTLQPQISSTDYIYKVLVNKGFCIYAFGYYDGYSVYNCMLNNSNSLFENEIIQRALKEY